MLVLSRKRQESVVIRDHHRLERMLKVTVMEIGPGRVKLGFEVKQDVPVLRGGVWERIVAGGRLENPDA